MHETIAHLGLLDEEAIVLDGAALQLAALDHPDVDLDPYGDILNAMSERIAQAGATANAASRQAEILNQIIAHEYGFVGDANTYDDPANTDMIRVIDRRRGLPISLSILYVAAARRVGWTADALNTPSHVLVRIGAETQSVLIDPFHRGGLVEPRQLAGLLAKAAGGVPASAAEHLAPLPNRLVLVRLLLNQATRAEGAGDIDRAVSLYERMTIVAPASGQGWWNHARLELVRGDVTSARASLSAMLEMTRDPVQREQISSALEGLAGRSSAGE